MAHLPPGGVLDMHYPQAAGQAKGLCIRPVPAVVIDGTPAGCRTGRGPDEAPLRAAELGQPIRLSWLGKPQGRVAPTGCPALLLAQWRGV
jgi:hypothetical protein